MPKPKNRITKDGRVKLKGKNYTNLRLSKYHEAYGEGVQKGVYEALCQCWKITGKECRYKAPWPNSGRAPMPWEGQLAHNPPKKMGNGFGSDTIETTLWLVGYCHDRLDNRNQKVVPKKPTPDPTTHKGDWL